MRRLIMVLAFLMFGRFAVAAEEWTGKVVAVADGDTLTALRDDTPVKIRLWGIDCPESHQDFGTVARRFLGDLAHNRTATVRERDRDRYGRVVALVDVDGVNVNRALVAAGLAWVYRRYCHGPERTEWLALETDAQTARLGLWAHPDPIPPWDWRQPRRSSPARETPNSAAAPQATTNGNPTVEVSPLTFRGNRNSRVFHRSTCSFYQTPKAALAFDSVAVAQQKGYRPCAHCLPHVRITPPARPAG